MASPCQVLIDAPQTLATQALFESISQEAWRIEKKFSRYRDDNLMHRINQHKHCELDPETQSLLEFAQQCYELSDGLFDVTSGVLRKAWNFKTMASLPPQSAIDALLPFIGFNKIIHHGNTLELPQGMEIDLGGIGKEYAVDKCWQILKQACPYPFLINFGGDLRVSGVRQNGQSWRSGVENPNGTQPTAVIDIKHGAITTSGTAMQHFTHNGVRYGHILNPKTGWPVSNPPLSITVAANSCIEAGLLSTLAMLQGENARTFLEEQEVIFWLQ
jgi:thiamine biosynthesis lipoprotein